MSRNEIIVRQLGVTHYLSTYHAMHSFTVGRDSLTHDELWLTEHWPVFTQGKSGKAKHILANLDGVDLIQTDRGGQVTYHGPGQQIIYTLIDLKRLGISVRELVTMLENAVITTLAQYGIESQSKADAPGVYVKEEKICSLGLHVQKGCSIHGLALNVDMDLSPFTAINPCGYAGLTMTQLSHFTTQVDRPMLQQQLTRALASALGYQQIIAL